MFDHFSRLLAQSALRMLQVWGELGGSVQCEALCKKCFGELLKVRSMWCFLRDVPFALCPIETVAKMMDWLLLAVGGSDSLESFASVLGGGSIHTVTHVLCTLERMGSSHAALSPRVLEMLLLIGFSFPASSALTYKLVRELIGTLCSSDPALVSHLLSLVSLKSLWLGLLFLLRELPTSNWKVLDSDVEILKRALMQPPESEASKVARQLIDAINMVVKNTCGSFVFFLKEFLTGMDF